MYGTLTTHLNSEAKFLSEKLDLYLGVLEFTLAEVDSPVRGV